MHHYSNIRQSFPPSPSLCRAMAGKGGERGIRTPGSPEGEQRFSRPPHSTTLPSLLKYRIPKVVNICLRPINKKKKIRNTYNPGSNPLTTKLHGVNHGVAQSMSEKIFRLKCRKQCNSVKNSV